MGASVEQKDNKEAEMGKQKKEAPMWDCGSTLYDSFERKAFERQLDSAIALSSRTLSMPHLSDRRVSFAADYSRPPSKTEPQKPPQVLPLSSKKTSKISRSFQKLLKSVFKPKQSDNHDSLFRSVQDQPSSKTGFFVVRERPAAAGISLSTIPEVPEFDAMLSPDIRSLVRKTASARFTGATSDRFPAASVGISCA